MHAGYRADIDGLRALAIIPVLLFHAGVPGFGGGYVGVDIFFVISGFLITGVIAREIDAEDFSILRFYERRARRIMPALIVMIIVVLAAAAWLYLPADLAKLPASAIAAALFYSNHHLFDTMNYFDAGAETKPLLHTWSLAVEEQFYIVFPLLLILVVRFASGRRREIIAGTALLSFMVAVATQGLMNGFAFYWLAPRAWELLIGSLAALSPPPSLGSRLREAIAAIGVGAIVFAVAAYSRATIFPGATALLPVLGAAAIIHMGSTTRVARLMAMPLLVGVGLISYSLYLWHWPIVVFAEYTRDEKLSGWASVAVIAMSFLCAVLSWRWIERPFRNPRQVDRKAILGWTGAGMATLCGASLALAATDGWSGRFTSEQLRFAASSGDVSPKREACHSAVVARGHTACTLGDAETPDALMWGDSHGVEYAYAIASLPQRSGRGLVQMTHSSCPPVIDYPIALPRCDAENAATIARIRADRRIRTIYLAAFWRYVGETQPPAFWRALDRTVATLVRDGRRVVIIGPVPSYPFDIPRALAHGSQISGMKRSDLVARTRAVRAVAKRWAGRGVVFIDPADSFCGPLRCELQRDGAALYYDAHHPSLTAARLVAAQIARTG